MHLQSIKKSRNMNTDYKVGDFIYDADIYDGLNKFLSDLEFYKKWLPKNKEAKILELCCGTGRTLRALIILHPCLNGQRKKRFKPD